MFDDHSETRFSDNEAHNADARWVTLFVHGRETAIAEGLLVPLQIPFGGEMIEVCFTDKLVVKYNGSEETLEYLAHEGLRLLRKSDSQDDGYYRRRQITGEDILVVQDPYSITLMTSDDWG